MGGKRPQHNIPRTITAAQPLPGGDTRGMSAAPERRGRYCSRGDTVTRLSQGTQLGHVPGPGGRAHRAGADAEGVFAAVPVPAVGAAVDGLADVAVPAVAGVAGAGHVHARL